MAGVVVSVAGALSPVAATVGSTLYDFVTCFYAWDVINYNAAGEIIVWAAKNCSLFSGPVPVHANETVPGLYWFLHH